MSAKSKSRVTKINFSFRHLLITTESTFPFSPWSSAGIASYPDDLRTLTNSTGRFSSILNFNFMLLYQ